MISARKSLLGDGILYWGFPILTALLLNGILISFIPGLVSPVSDRPPNVESIPSFRMVRIKPPVRAVEKKLFPKKTEPVQTSKVLPEITKTEFTPPKKLNLSLDLKTHLPTSLPTAKVLPVMDFTLPPLKIKAQPISLKKTTQPQTLKKTTQPQTLKKTTQPPSLEKTTQPPSLKKTTQPLSHSISTLKSFYTPDEIDNPLLPLIRNPPVYPRSAKRRGIQGWVDIVYTINRSGDVENVQIVKATPEGVYEKSVLRAVSGWRFSPGTVKGKPVNIRVKQRLRFELNHERN
ncbi:MAG: energy transducer TonB [Deltaproteobacteria bacterium]|nr:energy transducer TonB [Deltaproteobacteria bacterium]